jgi:hypothetical protein
MPDVTMKFFGLSGSTWLIALVIGGIVVTIIRGRRSGRQSPSPIGTYTVLSFGSLGLLALWRLIPRVEDPNNSSGFCYDNVTLGLLAALIVLAGSGVRIVLGRRSAPKHALVISSVTTGVAASMMLLGVFLGPFTVDGRVCIDESTPAIPFAALFISVVFATIGLFQKQVALRLRVVTFAGTALALVAFTVFFIILASHCC